MISKKAQQQALRDDNVRLADWWDDLSDEGKQKYIQEHPGSEKAKGGGGVGDVEKSDVAPEKKLFDQAHEILLRRPKISILETTANLRGLTKFLLIMATIRRLRT